MWILVLKGLILNYEGKLADVQTGPKTKKKNACLHSHEKGATHNQCFGLIFFRTLAHLDLFEV